MCNALNSTLRRRLSVLFFCCFAVWPTWNSRAQVAQVSSDTLNHEDRITLLRQPLENISQIERRLQLATVKIDALAMAGQREGQTEETVASAAGLLEAWQAYRNVVETAQVLLADLTSEASDKRASDAAAEAERVRDELKRLQGLDAPVTVTEDLLKTAEKLLVTAKTRVNVLSERQADRSALINGGFAEQRVTVEQELADLKKRNESVRQEIAAMPPLEVPGANEEGRMLVGDSLFANPVREQLEVKIATRELVLGNLKLREQLTDQQYRTDELILTEVRALAEALQRRVDALTAARGRSVIERLEYSLLQTDLAEERAVIELQLFVERVRAEHFAPSRISQPIREHDTKTGLAHFDDRLNRSSGRWDRLVRALTHYRSNTLLELRASLRRERAVWRTNLVELASRHEELMVSLQRIENVRRRASERFEVLAEEIFAKLEAAEASAESLAAVKTEVGTQRSQLNEVAQAAVEIVTPVVHKLDTMMTRVSEHNQKLARIGHSIYWRRMWSRDAGVLATNWRAASKSATGLFTGLFGAATVTKKRDQEDTIANLDAAFDVESNAAARKTRFGAALSSVTTMQASSMASAVFFAVAVGCVLLRITRRRGVALARRIEEDFRRVRSSEEETRPLLGISERVNLLVLNMVGDLAIIALVGVALVGAVYWFLADVMIQSVISAGIGLFVGTIALLRFVHHLFESESAPHRVIPCGDVVARHYRWWFGVFSMYSLVALMPLVMLYYADLSAILRAAVFEIYKTGALVLLLLFLLPRSRVLGQQDRLASNWVSLFLFIVHPLIVVSISSLLILQAIGYGALVTYVTSGLLNSFIVLGLLAIAGEYALDTVEHKVMSAPEGDGHLGGRPPFTKHDAQSMEKSAGYLLSFMKAIVRTIAVILVCGSILWIWDVPLDRGSMNYRVVGLSVLTALIATILDRVIYAALVTLGRTGKLPESTTRLIGRWTRGGIFLLAILTIIAIAGWKVDSIFTFVTTLLAMVAIGFVAVWSILSNFLVTMVLLVWKPFNVGEEVEILPEAISGQVVDINFMYTTLRSEDGKMTAVPNSMFVQKLIRRTPLRRGPKRTLAEQLESEEALD